MRNGSGGTQTTGKMLFPSLTSQFSPWLGLGVGVTSHSRGGLRPAQPLCHLPWGQARTFLMTEHPKDFWPYFIILILFFSPLMLIKSIYPVVSGRVDDTSDAA